MAKQKEGARLPVSRVGDLGPFEHPMIQDVSPTTPGNNLVHLALADISPRVAMMHILNEVFGVEFKWDDSAEATADRFIRYLAEYCPSERPFIATKFKEADATGLILVGPIAVSSICSHHLLPFYGHAWVGYIPSNGRIIGLSKVPRLVKWLATRPTNQERLTKKIAKWLDEELEPKGVMVVMRSTHTCMSCRGVRETDASMTTSLPLGVFSSAPAAREEFLALMRQRME